MVQTLKSKEYCHNCGKESEWEFKDEATNQIILCPLCGHKHYRVVTGQLVRPEIRWNGKLIKDVKKFLQEHPELKETFQKLEEEAEMKFEVSGDRWGTDPAQSQVQPVVGGSISYSWVDTSTIVCGSDDSAGLTPAGTCYAGTANSDGSSIDYSY